MNLINSRFRPVAPASLDQREVLRHPVLVERATVRKLKRQPSDACLVDLSTAGCRLTADFDVEVGEQVILRLNGSAAIAARVIWCGDGQMGCRFDEPLDRNLFRTLTLQQS